MRRWLVAVVASAVVVLSAPAQAEKRVALVVGNAAYVNIPQLANPVNDARLMADTLEALGFTLVGNGPQLDLDEPGLRRIVQAFGAQLQGADVGVFYYAGHGIQVRGANYLAPVGANPTREADVSFQMLDTNLVLQQMEGAGTRLNVVILDACRNNPFGGLGLRSAGSGLAQITAPQGTLISFATQPGNVALDGAGDNSPYTKALAETLRRPGLGIFDVFNEVGLAVKRATGGAQQPWVSSSPISGNFFFAGPPAGVTASPPVARADPDAAARRDYEFAERQNTREAWDAFLARHPSGFYAELARSARGKLAAVAPPRPPAAPPTPAQPAVGIFPGGVTPLPVERERTLRPKDTFKECDACPEMVVVPAGAFVMGSPANEPERGYDEGPQRRVSFARPFAVGRFAVTFEEWGACVADGGCNGVKPEDDGWGRGKRPVININWHEAKAYVAWLSRKTGKPYRLLSEAEREYVTRAGTATPFWWGASIATSQANYDGNFVYGGGPKGELRRKTMLVDSFKPNPWGLSQVHGNVWEWTEDCYNEGYRGAPIDGSARTTGECSQRVLRGGSWMKPPKFLRSAFRGVDAPDSRSGEIGLRVARTLTP